MLSTMSPYTDYLSPIFSFKSPLDSEEQTQIIVQSNEIRGAITHFLARCSIPLFATPYDYEFQHCCEEALRQGFSVDSFPAIRPFISGGVVMASTAYAHLNCKQTRIFIALYTAFLIYLDDVFSNGVEAVRGFNQRFMQGQPQGDAVLDAFATLLHGTSQHFDPLASDIIMTSTLNLVTALSLESRMKHQTLSPCAHKFPTFSRIMSGASEAFALFVFPPSIPLEAYIQALPEMMVFINNGNDILSFYKEDLSGESYNRISSIAGCYNISKSRVLSHLVDDAISSDRKISAMLAPCEEAHLAHTHFRRGYVGFHTSLDRYRLRELLLDLV